MHQSINLLWTHHWVAGVERAFIVNMHLRASKLATVGRKRVDAMIGTFLRIELTLIDKMDDMHI
jgi:hypothetical protein